MYSTRNKYDILVNGRIVGLILICDL